jgi:hypothetical protein
MASTRSCDRHGSTQRRRRLPRPQRTNPTRRPHGARQSCRRARIQEEDSLTAYRVLLVTDVSIATPSPPSSVSATTTSHADMAWYGYPTKLGYEEAVSRHGLVPCRESRLSLCRAAASTAVAVNSMHSWRQVESGGRDTGCHSRAVDVCGSRECGCTIVVSSCVTPRCA